MHLDVGELHLHVHADEEVIAKLNQILALLTQQGETMSALSDAVDALVQRVTEDTDHLLQLLADANARAEAAAANDAADAATIAQLQADNAAAMEDANATVARLQSIDPVTDFPAVEEPPVEEPPAEEVPPQ